MCRWLVWCSEEAILLADVVLEASNSLLHQSFNAGYHPGLGGKNNMTLNADGFGVGWYGKRGAAIYRSVTPAWNNRNLRELCGSIESQCIFAHVRATTPGSSCLAGTRNTALPAARSRSPCLQVRAHSAPC